MTLRNFLACVEVEVMYARDKFPSSQHQMTALVEEVGELAQALIENDRGNLSPKQVCAKAIQVAAQACRVALEGDESFAYTPEGFFPHRG